MGILLLETRYLALLIFFSNPDLPTRVGRLSYLEGRVAYDTANDNHWMAAVLNQPMIEKNNIWTDERSRAEIHFGSFALRMAPQSSLLIAHLSDNVLQVSLAQGSVDIHVHEMTHNHVIEVDLPNSAITLNKIGYYRFDVAQSGKKNTCTVGQGEATVFTHNTVAIVPIGHTLHIDGTEAVQMNLMVEQPSDAFDAWCAQRDAHEENPIALKYVPRSLVGYDDLDNNGTWQSTPEYGTVWIPTTVMATWVPYRYGHFRYIGLWGWTWIDNTSWGFAPFHYGRWINLNNRWVWSPGTYTSSPPVYAPALVAFTANTQDHISWFPLGYHEAYIPGYFASYQYVYHLNISHINMSHLPTSTMHANQFKANAVTNIPSNIFQSGKSVATEHVELTPQALQASRIIGSNPHVEPWTNPLPIAESVHGNLAMQHLHAQALSKHAYVISHIAHVLNKLPRHTKRSIKKVHHL